MSFISILKAVGKDLSHAGTWLDDGLKVAAPVIGVLDPPLAPIIAGVEALLGSLPAGTVTTEQLVQEVVTAMALIKSIESVTSGTSMTRFMPLTVTATKATTPAA